MEDKFEVLNPYFLNKFRADITDVKKIQQQGDRQYYPGMFKAAQSLDELFIYEKLKLYCSELSYRSISNPSKLTHTKTEFRFMESIFSEIEKDELLNNNKAIQIFNRLRIRLQEHYENKPSDIQKIEDIIQLIKQIKDILGLEDSMISYSLVNNLCIRNLNQGLREYAKPLTLSSCEILNLYYSSNAEFELPSSFIKNIISTVLIVEDGFFRELNIKSLQVKFREPPKSQFEWALQFINCYEKNLKKEDSQIYYHYSMAHVHYANQKYVKAHEHLLKLKHQQGVLINMSVKMLHLKVLYDLYSSNVDIGEIDAMEYIQELLENSRKLLEYDDKKKQQLGYQKTYNMTFLKYFKKLLRFSYDYEALSNRSDLKQKRKQKLKEEFGKQPYRFKDWLIEKLEEV